MPSKGLSDILERYKWLGRNCCNMGPYRLLSIIYRTKGWVCGTTITISASALLRSFDELLEALWLFGMVSEPFLYPLREICHLQGGYRGVWYCPDDLQIFRNRVANLSLVGKHNIVLHGITFWSLCCLRAGPKNTRNHKFVYCVWAQTHYAQMLI